MHSWAAGGITPSGGIEHGAVVEVFRRSGAALLALINDILDLSKIESLIRNGIEDLRLALR